MFIHLAEFGSVNKFEFMTISTEKISMWNFENH